MSWMDSWSRPSKHAAVPPPLYLTAGEDVPYCLTCGRVMNETWFLAEFLAEPTKLIQNPTNLGSRKSNKNTNNVVKYCSDRCRNRKPGPVDKKIERTIVALLNQEEDSGLEKTDAKARVVKGDHRIVVTCDEIEEIVFGSRADPKKVFGRRKNRATRVIGAGKEWKSVDMEDSDDDDHHHHPNSNSNSSDDDNEDEDEEEEGGVLYHAPEGEAKLAPPSSGPKIRPPQTESEVNFSVGGERGWAEKIEESPRDLEKKQEGQRKAEEREMVRRAARRAVVFGFMTDRPVLDNPTPSSKRSKHKDRDPKGDDGGGGGKEDGQVRRKCEALMQGSLVEPSFAKGNWSIRWRE